MNKLTEEQIIMTYNKLTGESYSLLSPEVDCDLLRAIIGEAWQRTPDGRKYVHLRIQKKAAVQCLAIARKRPFPDTNAKTAILSALTMLELNGIYVKLTDATASYLYHKVTDPDTTEDELAEWILANTSKSMD